LMAKGVNIKIGGVKWEFLHSKTYVIF
jgi:hypothetical protein